MIQQAECISECLVIITIFSPVTEHCTHTHTHTLEIVNQFNKNTQHTEPACNIRTLCAGIWVH